MEEKITVDEASEYMDITSEELDELMGEPFDIFNIPISEVNLIDKGGDEKYG